MSFGQVAFAVGMIVSGLLNLFQGKLESPWDTATWVPGQTVLAYATGALMVAGGIGLLVKRTSALSSRVLFWYLAFWLVVIKIPVVLSAPQNEVLWLNWGQIAVIVAGAWTLATTQASSLRAVRYLFGVAVIPIGLSHFFFLDNAITMVPKVLPFHPAWVIFTGVAHIAAGLGVLLGVKARLATILEASMLTAFAFLVWLHPFELVEFVVTIAVAGGAWAVADKIK